MATTNAVFEASRAPVEITALLVSLSPLPRESFDRVLMHLAEAFPGESVLVATPDAEVSAERMELLPGGQRVRVVNYVPEAPSPDAWTPTAADYVNAYELARKHDARAVLQLGAEAQSIAPAALRGLAEAVLEDGADLAMSRYALPPRAGLVNSAILYPLTRSLYGAHPRFPLALDLCMSARMAERMATAAQRLTAANQLDALLWPVPEAAVAGYTILDVEVGTRLLPQPGAQDLNTLLALVTGSLFADVDAKAAFWQRARVAQAPRRQETASAAMASSTDEVEPMLDAFRLAYVNLHEIWSLVLPPQSLLGLKRLAAMPAESFAMADSLWARIVYDFLLAFRLRTINRGHLLGALTPLYLGWVASHILQTGGERDPELHVEAVAAAFEADKPYLVSRWRWPDRFNP